MREYICKNDKKITNYAKDIYTPRDVTQVDYADYKCIFPLFFKMNSFSYHVENRRINNALLKVWKFKK